MSDLKPCPFCGSEDISSIFKGDWIHDDGTNIGHDYFAEKRASDTEYDAARYWNTRPLKMPSASSWKWHVNG